MINNSKKRIRHTFLHFACAFCLGNNQSRCQKGVKVVHSSKQFHLHNLPTSTTLNSRPSSYNGIVYDISRKWIFPAIFRPTESSLVPLTRPFPSLKSSKIEDHLWNLYLFLYYTISTSLKISRHPARLSTNKNCWEERKKGRKKRNRKNLVEARNFFLLLSLLGISREL